MSTLKIAITLDSKLLKEVDRLVKTHFFPNRSQAIQTAVREKLSQLGHHRLAKECAKLNPHFEQSLAEESFTNEMSEWPEY